MRLKIIPFFLGLLALCLCFGPAWPNPERALAASQAKKDEPSPLEDPRNIIRVLQRAIDTRDAELADSRIDFNRIGVIFLTNTMPQINERVRSGQLQLPQPLPSLMGSLNASSASIRRPAQLFLSGELRKLVLYGVASGYFAGNPRPQNELAALDGGLFLNFVELRPARLTFSPAVLAAQEEAGALILTSLTGAANGKIYELELILSRDGEIWQVYSIENAAELFEQALAGGN